jgi:hypothetical protein
MSFHKTPHTSCYRGKKVIVTLMDGERFVDRFKDRTDKWVFFISGRKERKIDIRAFAIYKPTQYDQHRQSLQAA